MTKNKIREHHIEHAFAAIDDHLSNMIQKLEKREDKSDVRIQELEEVIFRTDLIKKITNEDKYFIL